MFLGIFRGALYACVKDITYVMLFAAALAIANHKKPGDLILNSIDPTIHQLVTRAVE